MDVRRTPRTTGGFTLVELMVAVAILALLVAMLLPAVQSTRESARAVACKNHLRQVALALATYEGTHGEFPIGAASAPYRTMGVSWMVPTLPQLEETALADGYDRRSMHCGDIGLHASNRRGVAGKLLPVLRCPSSPFPELEALALTRTFLAAPSYVGIAGATPDEGFVEQRVSRCCLPSVDGEIGAGGMLLPGRPVRAREVTDGASKTLLLAEQSDYVYASDGSPHRIDSGFYQGWVAGTNTVGVPPAYGGTGAAYNITTVRYPVNHRDYGDPGVLDNRGPNNPLVAAHPGVVQGAFADGSVRTLWQSMGVSELKRMATRDDAETQSPEKNPL